MQSLFVTGTDTNVGKSVVTVLLALRLRELGIDAGVMKPMASGCRMEDGVLVSDDALFLKEMTGVDDDLDLINPIRLEEPLAPLVAARRCGQPTHDYLPRTLAAYAELQERHDCVIVEGVGGLLVPIAENDGHTFTCVDLANSLGLPVVLVARRILGTINHSVLTCRTALESPADFAGLVFSDAVPVDYDDIAAQTSPALISEMTGLPIWGQVPFLEELTFENLRQVASTFTLNFD